jgi:hypothetical protein
MRWLRQVRWTIPLLLAIAGIEVGLRTLPDGAGLILSFAEVACGIGIVVVLAKAALRKTSIEKRNEECIRLGYHPISDGGAYLVARFRGACWLAAIVTVVGIGALTVRRFWE